MSDDLDSIRRTISGWRGAFTASEDDDGVTSLVFTPVDAPEDEVSITDDYLDLAVLADLARYLATPPVLLAEIARLTANLSEAASGMPIRCQFHASAEVPACGCPPLDSPGALDYRALLATARAEIARLTAELAAARAVPADVEAAIARVVVVATRDGIGIDASNVLSSRPSVVTDAARNDLRAAIARAIADKHLAAIRAVERIESTSKALGYSADYMAAIDHVLTHLRAVGENGGPLTSQCDAAAPPATVGGLLATARDRHDCDIIEFYEGTNWMQVVVFGGVVRWRVHDSDDGWFPTSSDLTGWHSDEFIAEWIAAPARFVPAHLADVDPATRGPIEVP